MTDAPERISLLPGDGWSWCEGRPVHEEDAVEYIRADLAVPQADIEAHIGAVLSEAAQMVDCCCDQETKARVLSVPPNSADRWRGCGQANCGAMDADTIHNLRPDAMQALERVRREARVEVLEKLEHAMHHHAFTDAEWNRAEQDVRTAFSIYLRKLIAAEKRGEGE